jgi:hypothetical protein
MIWLVFLQNTISVQLNMSEHENGQAVRINRRGRSKVPSERWEQIKTAYASGIGLREIARELAIPEGTVLAHAKRKGWTRQIQSAKALAKHDDRAHAVTPMEAVAGTLSKRKDKSALHLSRYVVDASRNAAMSRGDLEEAQNVRHVADPPSAGPKRASHEAQFKRRSNPARITVDIRIEANTLSSQQLRSCVRVLLNASRVSAIAS